MIIYLMQGTHWDREWHHDFQHFRYRLVGNLDRVLEILENDPGFPTYHLDGQTVVIEDYLEIRPENRERFRKLLQEGRMTAGPWYVMADELTVSGESLIQNLHMGSRICRELGTEPMHYGYVCDIFGHIPQLPQILKGFGIDGAYLSRGVGDDKQEISYFVWRAPDGSECMALHDPYGKFYCMLLEEHDEKRRKALVDAYIGWQREKCPIPVIFLSYTQDHTWINEKTKALVEDIRTRYPDAELRTDGIDRMAREVAAYRDELPLIEGELISNVREQDTMRCVTNSISSYYPLKKANDETAALLERTVGPLTVMNRLLGGKRIPEGFTRTAWKWLLKNQCHDSICGCSIDQVHKDMEFRFDQSREIAETVIEAVTDDLKGAAGTGAFGFRVVHTDLYDFDGVCELKIDFPTDYPWVYRDTPGFETLNSFRIADADGNDVPYQMLSVDYVRRGAVRDVYHILVKLKLPAFSVTEYRILPVKSEKRMVSADGESFSLRVYGGYSGLPMKKGEPMPSGMNWMDNGILRVTVSMDGTLTLLDHRSGKEYSGLNVFQDDADYGNGWYHSDDLMNETVCSAGSPCTIRKTVHGRYGTSFRVEKRMLIPVSFDEASKRRTKACRELVLDYTVSLKAGDAHAEITLETENNCENHRLSLVFPTGIGGDTYTVRSAFAYTERKTGRDRETDSWYEPEPLEKPMAGTVFKRAADETGLAFVSAAGLHECAWDNDPDETLRVTLFRAFGIAFGHGLTEKSQLKEKMRFRYAIAPLDKEDSIRKLEQIARTIGTEPVVSCFGTSEDAVYRNTDSLFRLDSASAVLSTVKEAENGEGLIVRFWNASGDTERAVFESRVPGSAVVRTDLSEETAEELPGEKDKKEIMMKPWEIVTLKITLDERSLHGKENR